MEFANDITWSYVAENVPELIIMMTAVVKTLVTQKVLSCTKMRHLNALKNSVETDSCYTAPEVFSMCHNKFVRGLSEIFAMEPATKNNMRLWSTLQPHFIRMLSHISIMEHHLNEV